MEDVADEQEEFRLLGKYGVEDPPRGVVGRVEEGLAEMLRDLGHALQRHFQMEIAGVNESERPL